MKKIHNLTLAFAVLTAIVFFVTSCGDSVVNKLLEKVAVETNKICPMAIDQVTTLDSLRVLEPRTLGYFYSISVPPEQINKDALDQVIRPNLILNSKNPQGKPLRAAKVTLRHVYLDAGGQVVYQTDITPEDYKE